MTALTALIPLVYPFALVWRWLATDWRALRLLGCPQAERAGLVVTASAIVGGWATFAVDRFQVGVTPASWLWVVLAIAWWVLIIWGNPGYVLLRRLVGCRTR